MKSNARLRQHVHAQLQEERMVQIMAETRRNGTRGWIPRHQLHADEILREERIKSMLPSVDQLMVVALNPDTGGFGVFEVIKPEPELDFENGGTEAANPLQSAQRAAALHAEHIQLAGVAAEKTIKGIRAGTIKHYEDLVTQVPVNVRMETVLSMLSQAGKPLIDLETLKGRVATGGVELPRKSLGCQSTFQILADIREIDDDGSPNGTLSFKIQSNVLAKAALPDILQSKKRIGAALQTGSDFKSLALLHFAKVHSCLVKLELQMVYLIAERRWDIKVVEILDEKELLAKDRPAQAVFSDW